MRIKRGLHHIKRRKNILKKTKGFQHGRNSLIAAARVAIIKAGKNAYRGRKEKKRINKGLWNIRINAALRQINEKYSYSKFMNALHTKNIALDRKALSELAKNNFEAFSELVKKVM
jgi:large subunit ribosomal protein L20